MIAIDRTLTHHFNVFRKGSTFAANEIVRAFLIGNENILDSFKIKLKSMTMNHPMITWCVIAAILLCVILIRTIRRHASGSTQGDSGPRHFLEFGNEKEMFFIPGDTDEEDDIEVV